MGFVNSPPPPGTPLEEEIPSKLSDKLGLPQVEPFSALQRGLRVSPFTELVVLRIGPKFPPCGPTCAFCSQRSLHDSVTPLWTVRSRFPGARCGVDISKLLKVLYIFFALKSALPLFENSLSCFLSRV